MGQGETSFLEVRLVADDAALDRRTGRIIAIIVRDDTGKILEKEGRQKRQPGVVRLIRQRSFRQVVSIKVQTSLAMRLIDVDGVEPDLERVRVRGATSAADVNAVVRIAADANTWHPIGKHLAATVTGTRYCNPRTAAVHPVDNERLPGNHLFVTRLVQVAFPVEELASPQPRDLLLNGSRHALTYKTVTKWIRFSWQWL